MILHRGISSSRYTSLYCIVPARAGSKGLKSKNSLPLNGIPLAEHTLSFASLLPGFDEIIFTTDCPYLLSRSSLYPQISYHSRDISLAGDKATLVDVIFSLYTTLLVSSAGDNPAFVLFQPTSPFRCLDEVKRAIHFASNEGLDSLVSVSSNPFHPSECLSFNNGSWDYLLPPPDSFTGRQDYSLKSFFISGSFYISSLSHLISYRSFLSQDSSFFHAHEPYVIDIDTSADFEAAKALYPLMHAAGYAAPFR